MFVFSEVAKNQEIKIMENKKADKYYRLRVLIYLYKPPLFRKFY